MEEWKDIPDAPGYQASSLGRIRSKTKVLSQEVTGNGYLRFRPGRGKRGPKGMLSHRAVAAAFYGKSDLQVNHLNGVKSDNRPENLEYCTASNNMTHAVAGGLIKNAKLSSEDVSLIRYWGVPGRGGNMKTLAKIFSISLHGASAAFQKRSYAAMALAAMILTGCPKREKILAHMWLQSGLPAAVCAQAPDAAKSGIYRRLNDDQCPKGKAPPCYEFISYCNAQVRHYFSIQDQEFNDMLDKYLPRRSEKQGAEEAQ